MRDLGQTDATTIYISSYYQFGNTCIYMCILFLYSYISVIINYQFLSVICIFYSGDLGQTGRKVVQ